MTDEGKKRYYNSDGTLNKKGRKAQKEFEKNVSSNWINAYNDAANKFNKRINQINTKYEDEDLGFDGYTFTTKIGKTYQKEVNDIWQRMYRESASKYFGKNPFTEKGYEYLENLPFMNEYLD